MRCAVLLLVCLTTYSLGSVPAQAFTMQLWVLSHSAVARDCWLHTTSTKRPAVHACKWYGFWSCAESFSACCLQYCNGAGTVMCPHCGGFKLKQARTAAGQLKLTGGRQSTLRQSTFQPGFHPTNLGATDTATNTDICPHFLVVCLPPLHTQPWVYCASHTCPVITRLTLVCWSTAVPQTWQQPAAAAVGCSPS